MAYSAALGAFVTVESSPHITDPPAAVRKHTQIRHLPPNVVELDALTLGHGHNTPSQPPTLAGAQTPFTPNELEMSRPSSPGNGEAVEIMQTLSNPRMNKWRFCSCCLMCFANGLNDSAPGALIPYMEKTYSIGYAIVSLIFIRYIQSAFHSCSSANVQKQCNRLHQRSTLYSTAACSSWKSKDAHRSSSSHASGRDHPGF